MSFYLVCVSILISLVYLSVLIAALVLLKQPVKVYL